jgi:hypothetical protein
MTAGAMAGSSFVAFGFALELKELQICMIATGNVLLSSKTQLFLYFQIIGQ